VDTLKTLLHSSPTENGHFTKAFLILVQPFATAPEPLKECDHRYQTCPCVHWFRWGASWVLLWTVTR